VTRRARIQLTLVAACFAVAFAWPVHVFPCGTQSAHYALVQSLAQGTSRIDAVHEITCDKAWVDGHYYSVKAPGLALMALPAYVALDATGLLPGNPRWAVWLLSLVTLLPLALLLVYLVGRTAERLTPGSGVLTAVALGAGTIVLPFSSLWFGHVPAAAAAFASYAVIRRPGPPTWRRGFGAGLLAGAAVLFEYPVALVAIALVAYAVGTRGWRFGASVCVGGAVPAVALLAYNHLAFGSITHFSYESAVIRTGFSGHDVVGANDEGFFGIGRPSVHALTDLLVSPRGLLTLTPICILGAAGIVLLYRRARADAILCASLTVAFLVYNAGYTLSFGGPFGGDSPGPRFLVATLPFLLLPLGLAARRWPGATGALLVISIGWMTLATATAPMVGEGEVDRWRNLLGDGAFVTTPFTAVGLDNGWVGIAPFVVAAGGLLGIGVAGVRRGLTRAPGRTSAQAAVASGIWLLLFLGSRGVYADRALGPERGRAPSNIPVTNIAPVVFADRLPIPVRSAAPPP
jgi:hypothetical protein